MSISASATDIQITPFASEDHSGVLDLILPIQQVEFGIEITAGEQPDLGVIPEFYQTGTGGFWLAKSGGRVVGTIGLRDIGNQEAALRKMFVAAAYRGPAFATAGKLLAALLTAAAGHGIRTIFLGTTDQFVGAHRFYEKNGFVRIDRRALPETFPLMAVDTRFYALRLSRGQAA